MRTAFLFPGHGAYLPGVLRLLGAACRRTLATVDAVAEQFGRPPVSPLLLGTRPVDIHRLIGEPELYDLAVFATSMALADVLEQHCGLRPDAVLGYGMGEIAALTAAGVFTLQDGARVICERGGALRRHPCPPGGVMAVEAPFIATVELLSDITRGELVVCGLDSSERTTVAGLDAGLHELTEMCRALEIGCRRVATPGLEHHELVTPARDALREALEDIRTRPPSTPAYLVHAQRWYDLDDVPASVVTHHLFMPVRFAVSMRDLIDSGISGTIECGAGTELSMLVTDISPDVVAVAPLTTPATPGRLRESVAALPGPRRPPAL